jgi:hypothetical protein
LIDGEPIVKSDCKWLNYYIIIISFAHLQYGD